MQKILVDVIDFVEEKDSISEDLHNIIRILYNSVCCNKITVQNMVSYIIYLMQLADQFTDIQNTDKKKCVLFVLNKFIDINITYENEKQIMHTFVNEMVPELIDTLVSIDNSEIIINLKNKAESCLTKFKKKMCCC